MWDKATAAAQQECARRCFTMPRPSSFVCAVAYFVDAPWIMNATVTPAQVGLSTFHSPHVLSNAAPCNACSSCQLTGIIDVGVASLC